MKKSEDSLTPLSTVGMGSVPFKSGEEGCETLFRQWDIPFWPQYPTRSIRENFLFQFLSTFPGLRISGSSASFNEADYLAREKRYREKLDEAFSGKNFQSFEPPPNWAWGYSEMKRLLEAGAFPEKRVMKLQVTGPSTVWQSFFKDRVPQKQACKLQNDLCRSLTAAGLAQIERVRSCGRTALIFIDEPLRSENLSGLEEMIGTFRNFGALVGLHACSNLDWKDFESLKMDLFHFDATVRSQWESHHYLLVRTFLKKRGGIAWGIIPTAPNSDFEARDFSLSLLEWLKEFSDEVLPVEVILKQSLIAPACGTGTLSLVQSQAVSESARRTTESLRPALKKLLTL